MKDDYLSFRLPAELARALARKARAGGMPKSAVVREAVVRYLAPAPPEGVTRRVTGRELRALLESLPRLSPEDAEAFARDVASARADLARTDVSDPWES